MPLESRLRLMSVNLANGGADPEGLAALVEVVEPDVVACQELTPAQAEALARLLPFGKLDPARDHSGMGIALRRPGTVWRVPLPHRDAHVAEIGDAGNDPVEVVNVHIAAPHVLPPWRALARRRGQLAGLEAYLDGAPRRRVVVGDLNSTTLWPVYRRLRRRLADAAVAAAREAGARPRRTWGPWPGSPRLLRIDHILMRGLAAERVLVLPVPGTDHSAVVADLSLAPEAP